MSRIEELEKRLAADPNSRMFVQLAEEYRKAGMLEQAIDVCEQGIKKHPQYPSARVALGRALLEAEQLDRASQEFEAVLKQVPDNILANKFLGQTYHRLGRLEEALKKYNIAHTLAPEDTEIGEHIQQVQAEIAGGGAAMRASAPPAEAPAAAAPPPPPRPAAPPQAAVPERPVQEQAQQRSEESGKPPEELPPIPLVEVDEPMVLERRDYLPPSAAEPGNEPAATPSYEAPSSFDELEPPLEPTLVEPAPSPPPSPQMDEPPSFVEPEPPPPPFEPAPPTGPAAFTLPAASPPPAESPSTSGDIETPTMAEIYASQGHFEQAVAVYRRIVEHRPNEPKYRERLEELQMLASATQAQKAAPSATSSRGGTSSGHERTIRVLEQWLEAIRKSKGA
jgi:tetratricopeptide (TPR) repeat protein